MRDPDRRMLALNQLIMSGWMDWFLLYRSHRIISQVIRDAEGEIEKAKRSERAMPSIGSFTKDRDIHDLYSGGGCVRARLVASRPSNIFVASSTGIATPYFASSPIIQSSILRTKS